MDPIPGLWFDLTSDFERFRRKRLGQLPHGEDLHATARKWLQQRCKPEAEEYLVLIDESDGWIQAGTTHEEKTCGWSPEAFHRKSSRDSRLTVWHGHPDYEGGEHPGIALPSDADVRVLADVGVSRIGVVNNQGEFSTARIDRSINAFGEAYVHRLMEWSEEADRILDGTIKQHPQMRNITVRERSLLFMDAHAWAMEGAGFIELDTTLKMRSPWLTRLAANPTAGHSHEGRYENEGSSDLESTGGNRRRGVPETGDPADGELRLYGRWDPRETPTGKSGTRPEGSGRRQEQRERQQVASYLREELMRWEKHGSIASDEDIGRWSLMRISPRAPARRAARQLLQWNREQREGKVGRRAMRAEVAAMDDPRYRPHEDNRRIRRTTRNEEDSNHGVRVKMPPRSPHLNADERNA